MEYSHDDEQEQNRATERRPLLETENLGRTGFEKRVVDDITVQVQKGETVSPYIQISYKASLIPAIDSTFDAARMLFFPSAIVREACSQIDATI